jgi:hypothetical protein
MNNYNTMASIIQSSISVRAWAITKEQAFHSFYKEHGRMKEARKSKEELKVLHKLQVQDKRVLSVIREVARWDGK